jgi:large subunit ribosomal protein L6
MSRIGKKPISIPQGVQIDWKDGTLSVRGPKGELRRQVGPGVLVKTENDQLLISVENGSSKTSKAIHGLHRALIANMVAGVSQGFERGLEIVGIGYRAELAGRKMTFHLGYSHPIDFELPEGIEAKVDRTKITLSGIDKELLGETAAKIRGFRKPEPYKGKGIKYADEIIKRKAGKTGAK